MHLWLVRRTLSGKSWFQGNRQLKKYASRTELSLGSRAAAEAAVISSYGNQPSSPNMKPQLCWHASSLEAAGFR